MRQAIELAAQIQSELERVLEDVNEILRILEQAEREKNASEAEIEALRESLHRIQHGRGPVRPARFSRPSASEPPTRPPEAEAEAHAPEPEEPAESREPEQSGEPEERDERI